MQVPSTCDRGHNLIIQTQLSSTKPQTYTIRKPRWSSSVAINDSWTMCLRRDSALCQSTNKLEPKQLSSQYDYDLTWARLTQLTLLDVDLMSSRAHQNKLQIYVWLVGDCATHTLVVICMITVKPLQPPHCRFWIVLDKTRYWIYSTSQTVNTARLQYFAVTLCGPPHLY